VVADMIEKAGQVSFFIADRNETEITHRLCHHDKRRGAGGRSWS
jgi:hypothetical protein